MITPIFHTNHSLRSILNLSPSGKSKESEAPSLFDAAKDLGLNTIHVIDDIPSAFMELVDQSQKEGLKLVLGLRFIICNDVEDKTEESIASHARYNIIARNNNGYKRLIKLYIESGTSGDLTINKLKKYRRLDRNLLEKHFNNDDLYLMPCFYDGPNYMGLFHFSTHCFDPSPYSPVYELQSQSLPFDGIISDSVNSVVKCLGGSTIHTHSCYYRFKSEFPAFITYKCIVGRSPSRTPLLNAPNQDNLHSNTFCSEAIKDDLLYRG